MVRLINTTPKMLETIGGIFMKKKFKMLSMNHIRPCFIKFERAELYFIDF